MFLFSKSKMRQCVQILYICKSISYGSKGGGGISGVQLTLKFCNIYIRNLPKVQLEVVGGLRSHIIGHPP